MEHLEDRLRRVVESSLQKPPEDMLADCLDMLIHVSGAAGGSILGEEGPSLKFLFANVPELIGRTVPWTSIAGETTSRNVIIYTYAPEDKRHFSGIDSGLARRTDYLLSVPIPSVHNRSDCSGAKARATGALQLLFRENIFPGHRLEAGPVEFSIDGIREHEVYMALLKDVFMLLSTIAMGLEIMKLRQTSYQAIHELKNKLISAQSWLNCLHEDLEDTVPDCLASEAIVEDFTLAGDAVSSGAKLALGYLQFTKIYTPAFEDCQVNDVVGAAARDIQTFADDLGTGVPVRVRTALDPAVPVATLDPAQLRMALFNLGKNAVEALAEHAVATPCVTLSAACDADGILLEVADNGPGMPEEIAANLFVAFKTKKAGGTGLGLTITKKIVDVHRGSIRCRTGADGTRFSIRL